ASTPAPATPEGPRPSAVEAPATDVLSTGSIRVEADRIERMLYGVEEMLHLKRSLAQRLSDLRALIAHANASGGAGTAGTGNDLDDTGASGPGRPTNTALKLGGLYRDLERDRWRF